MSATAADALDIAWHDAECGGYAVDLPVWRELAGPGPVLDVGAGTGRVALDLAARGLAVTALDRDAVLLAELARRAEARALEVRTVVADAAGFAVPGERFAAILVPMQTVQLLPDRAARTGLLASARAHLAAGGLVALAIAAELEPFDAADGPLPAPDVLERDGRRFESQPVAVRRVAGATAIDRLRRVDGGPPVPDRVVLADLAVATLHGEGEAVGLRPARGRLVPATTEHVGSEVVVFRG